MGAVSVLYSRSNEHGFMRRTDFSAIQLDPAGREALPFPLVSLGIAILMIQVLVEGH